MATYTPFIERNTDKIAGAIQQKQVGDLSSSAYMGDQSALEQLYGVNPQLAERIQMKKQQEAQNKLAQKSKQANMLQEIGKETINMEYEQAAAYAQRRAREMGIEAPLMPREVHEQMKKAFGKPASQSNSIGAASPKDFTPESLSDYSATGDISKLVRYSPQVKDIAGIPHQINPVTQKWEPIVNLNDPNIAEQTKALSKIEADKQSEKDFAKNKEKWKSTETQIINAISAADSKTELLNNTTDKLKGLLEDRITKYGSGLLSKLPASDERTIKGLITTIKANSTFTTLTDLKAQGGTLGAIAAAELELLSAALGELDQAGDSTEVLRVLDQISKANNDSVARLKAGYERDKSIYSKGYESVDDESSPPQVEATNSAPQAAIQMLMQNPQLADQFKAKFGYLPEGL